MRFCICCMLVLTASLRGAPEKPGLAEFSFVEAFGFDWPETLVTYAVSFPPGAAASPALRLEDDAGVGIPCQLSAITRHADGTIATARVSFKAAVAKGEGYRYRLVHGEPVATAALQASEEPNGLTLANSLTAIRLPPVGEQVFEEPLGWDEPRLPGPIQGFRLADGRWTGGSAFQSRTADQAPRLRKMTCRLVEQGPLFLEADVTYLFENDAWYRLTARVLDGEPLIQVDEECEFGRTEAWGEKRLVVSFAGDWQPDIVFGASPESRLKGQDETFVKRLTEAGYTPNPRGFSRPLVAMAEDGKVVDIAPWYPWHPNAIYVGLARRDDFTNSIAIVPLNAGTWRGDSGVTAGSLIAGGNTAISLQWNLSAMPHPANALHTGEVDPELPLARVRHRWALVLGAFGYDAPLKAIRNHLGFVSLDQVKDWQLDWRRDPAITWPRLTMTRAEADAVAPGLDRHPMGNELREQLIFTDTPERAAELWKRLQQRNEWSGPLGQLDQILRKGGASDGQAFWMHFRQAQMAGWAPVADELLASRHLSDDQRALLLKQIAGLCYALAEPDANPRGSLVHLGNPNMPINRFMALPFAAALIPDHPKAARWLDTSRENLRYKLAMNIAPGGAWSELITYFGASAPHVMQGAMVLERTGRMDDATARLATLPATFTLQLLTPPDPRFGVRTVPGWGHEGAVENTHWLPAAALMRQRDPELAKAFAWAWDQCGRPLKSHHDAGFSPYAAVHADLLNGLPAGYLPPDFSSTWFPGVGAVLRDRAGTPDETYVALRNGYMVSHSDPNQGDFVFYAKGAPLVTLSLHAYPLHQLKPVQDLNNGFGWHSVPRIGDRANVPAWPGGGAYGGIPSYSFSDSIDYLRAWGDYGQTRWTRQMMLVKGQTPAQTTYLMLRDSFRALEGEPQPVWWNLRTLGKKEQITPLPNGFRYRSEFGVEMDVTFPGLEKVQVESRDATYTSPLYFGSARTWAAAGSPMVKQDRPSPDSITIEETLTVTSVGPLPAGKDIFVVLYPRRAGEAEPACALLANGLIAVTTESGTDHLFLTPAKAEAAHGDLAFAGTAGAVRFLGEQAQFVVAEGGTTATWKKSSAGHVNPRPSVTTLPLADAEQGRLPTGDPVWQPETTSRLGNDSVAHFYLAGEGSQEQAGIFAATTGAAFGSGVVELAVHPDRILGTSDGLGRLLYITKPPKLDRLPVLLIAGQTYAPGVSGNTLIVPLLPGKHSFEVRAIDQPPIFRDWRYW